ncbi:MAG: hypothetical protein VCD00_13600 [Candidatus Hydrogenedentota bacterium]
MSPTAISQLKIAVFYRIDGWPVSDERIIGFFQEYSVEGVPIGEFVYGTLLREGLGVEQDIAKGNKLIEESGINPGK